MDEKKIYRRFECVRPRFLSESRNPLHDPRELLHGEEMIINLLADDSVSSAPSGFSPAIRSAADFLQQTFTDNITVNIRYGWGTWNNQSSAFLTNSHGALGGATALKYVSYADLSSWLRSKATSNQDLGAISSLPVSAAALPTNTELRVASAELKALGHFSGDPTALDGAVGFGTATSSSDEWVPAALHELTHAMGRQSGVKPTGTSPTVLDIFRYSAPNTYQWSAGQTAYFSVDGGNSSLAPFDTNGDTGDFLGGSNAPDPFNDSNSIRELVQSGNADKLTPVDISVMDVIGFTPVGAHLPPSPSNAIAVRDTTTGQSVPSAGLAYSGPVPGLQHQYIYPGQDNVNVTVADDNWFLHGGPGTDALSAHGGYNVLDGDTGSNFLTGGTGTDTFFVDDRSPPADIWSTVTAFHGGDDVTVFGVTPVSANLQWFNNQGASGFTGLTLHATTPNQPTASLTLPGYGVSDLNNGRLTVAFGSEPDGTPFMHITGNS